MLHVQTEGTNQPEHFESINGITPAMRNARKRHFNNAHIDHLEVQAVEDDLLQLASVRVLLTDMLTVITAACTAQVLINQQICVTAQPEYSCVQGRAPQNMVIEDVEEEYKVDEYGNGSWQPVEKKAAPKVLLNVKGEPGTKPKRKKAVKKPSSDVEQL